MIVDRPTVLILGAGTSMPYGFPSGLTLLRIIQLSIQKRPWFQKLLEAGADGGELTRFRESVAQCGRSSIDAFLEGRPDVMKAGRFAIAAALAPFEEEGALYRDRDTEDDIYRYIFTRLSDGCSTSDFEQHKLTIVTYNYDRSFEHYMFNAVRYSYGLTEVKAATILATSMPVLHVHGRLAALPWQTERVQKRSYAPGNNPDEIQMCAQQIQVISEADVDGGSEYVAARAALKEADVVCFLGFGYHRANLERLRIGDWKPGRIAYGTCCGMSPVEIRKMKEALGGLITDGQPNFESVSFLRDVGPIL